MGQPFRHYRTGPCPVCDGCGRVPVPPDRDRANLKHIYGYDEASHTFLCRNCGGQYMGLTPTGVVRLDQHGAPCTHEYEGKTIGNCLNRYTCRHCGDVYVIDSGD